MRIASRATGRSLVPAVTTATCGSPAGSRSAAEHRGARHRIVVEQRLLARRQPAKASGVSRVSSSDARRARASAIASPICCGVLPAQSTASLRPIRSRRWKSKVTSDMGPGAVEGAAHAVGLVAHALGLAVAGEQPLDRLAGRRMSAGSDPRQAGGIELDRDAVQQQPAAHRARRQLVLDQPLDRVDQPSRSAVTGSPVSSRLERQGAAGSSARSSRPRLRASARTLALSIPAST